jgi:hypothetical protein
MNIKNFIDACEHTSPRAGVAKVVQLTLQLSLPTSLYTIAFLLSLGPNLKQEMAVQSKIKFIL